MTRLRTTLIAVGAGTALLATGAVVASTATAAPAPVAVTTELVRPAGPLRKIEPGKSKQPVAAMPVDADFAAAAVWRIKLPANIDWSADTLLRLHYTGDVARVYIGGKFINDDYYNGQPLDLGLRRHAADPRGISFEEHTSQLSAPILQGEIMMPAGLLPVIADLPLHPHRPDPIFQQIPDAPRQLRHTLHLCRVLFLVLTGLPARSRGKIEEVHAKRKMGKPPDHAPGSGPAQRSWSTLRKSNLRFRRIHAIRGRQIDLSRPLMADPLPLPSFPTLREAVRYWLRLGCISFGGPAGQIAIMHRELVEQRRWISNRHFREALNFCMLLPGPEAQQLATYLGWRLHGWRGGVAGSGRMSPRSGGGGAAAGDVLLADVPDAPRCGLRRHLGGHRRGRYR